MTWITSRPLSHHKDGDSRARQGSQESSRGLRPITYWTETNCPTYRRTISGSEPLCALLDENRDRRNVSQLFPRIEVSECPPCRTKLFAFRRAFRRAASN